MLRASSQVRRLSSLLSIPLCFNTNQQRYVHPRRFISMSDENPRRRTKSKERRQPKDTAPRERGGGGERGGRGGGARGGRQGGRRDDAPDVHMSKALSYVLRHGAAREGLAMRPDGFVRVDDLLAQRQFAELTFAGLQRIVANNEKQRFALRAEPAADAPAREVWWIRANQGHSIVAVELDMDKIMDASRIPMAVHGTRHTNWANIQRAGLSRMSRNHVHLAQGLPGADGVISGMRKSSEILIFLDVRAALAAGIPFFLSANGVVLTPGDEKGFIPPSFFLRVEDGKTREPLHGWDGPRSSVLDAPSAPPQASEDDAEDAEAAWAAIAQQTDALKLADAAADEKQEGHSRIVK